MHSKMKQNLPPLPLPSSLSPPPPPSFSPWVVFSHEAGVPSVSVGIPQGTWLIAYPRAGALCLSRLEILPHFGFMKDICSHTKIQKASSFHAGLFKKLFKDEPSKTDMMEEWETYRVSKALVSVEISGISEVLRASIKIRTGSLGIQGRISSRQKWASQNKYCDWDSGRFQWLNVKG